MPLDQQDYLSAGDQRLLKLAKALRDSDFPPDFIWNYPSCGTCAFEVGRFIFGYKHLGEFALTCNELLGLNYQEGNAIFITAAHDFSNKCMAEIQPEDVAQVIERLVAARVNA